MLEDMTGLSQNYCRGSPGMEYYLHNGVLICAEDLTAISIPDCGHYIPEEKPEEMLKAFNEFPAN